MRLLESSTVPLVDNVLPQRFEPLQPVDGKVDSHLVVICSAVREPISLVPRILGVISIAPIKSPPSLQLLLFLSRQSEVVRRGRSGSLGVRTVIVHTVIS